MIELSCCTHFILTRFLSKNNNFEKSTVISPNSLRESVLIELAAKAERMSH